MKIGTRTIGEGVYVIAEIGVNHDGSLHNALTLVRHAASVGADAVKFQHFSGAALGKPELERYELGEDGMREAVSLAHSLGLHAIVTVFGTDLVASAERIPWDAYKTASPEIVNRPLIQALARTGKPLILSTGASWLGEVVDAIGWLGRAMDRTALLQCVSAYPCLQEHAELGAIQAIAEVFDGPVGYSDHTTEEFSGAHAVAAGAVILEKHMTYSRQANGPDHAMSMEPDAMARYVRLARDSGGKRCLSCESAVRRLRGRGMGEVVHA